LQNLTRLNLNYNRIQILPESIGDLTKLNYLKIENNDLSILPRRIVELVELEEFYFAHNDINNLPEEFEKLQNLKSISYKSWNRWEGHWEHILKQGVPALLEYCRQLSQWNPEIIINALRKNQFPAESELNNPRLGKHIGFLEQQCKVIHTEAAEKFFDWLIVQFKIEQKGTGDCVLL
jgi:Leucine-rich repeat (LRR) protein